jgi:hypothetical protein
VQAAAIAGGHACAKIARNVAEAHGGIHTLAEAPGGGTRPIVELPLFVMPAKTASQTR